MEAATAVVLSPSMSAESQAHEVTAAAKKLLEKEAKAREVEETVEFVKPLHKFA